MHRAPVAYQVSNGVREIVDSGYALRTVAGEEAGRVEYRVGFDLGAYDHTRRLIIDPEISYSSYLGGSKLDWSSDIAVDSEGQAYIVGYTASPRTFDVGGFSGDLAGDVDVFVAKFSKSGGELVYSTYIGGSEDDNGLAIAVDGVGAAYITGLTESEDYPVTDGAFRDRFPKGQTSSFVTKLSPSGDALDYSTYIGGRSGSGIAIDLEGNAYITGHATASDFPTSLGSFQPAYVHGFEAFVAKLNKEGSGLAYATYLGGEGADFGTAIAVDLDGSVYFTGRTDSEDFPTTDGVFSSSNSGELDVFVARLNEAGSELIYSTLLGGEEDDLSTDIALDSAGNAYVTGETASDDFPSQKALNGDFSDGGVDAFVTGVDPTGGALVFSINVGAESVDVGNSIALDRYDNVWVAGETDSSDMETRDPVQSHREGGSDAFVVKLEAGGERLLFSTFLGGDDNDVATGIAVDESGSAYVTGVSYSTDFPVGDSVQEELEGDGDAFVTKISFLADLTLEERPLIRNDSGGVTQDLTYTLVVTNNGPDKATNVSLVDYLPEGAVLISAVPTKGRWTDFPKGSCAEDSGIVTCDLGKLGVGTSARVTITVAPTISGTQANAASVEGGQIDSYMADNAVDAQTDLVAPLPTATPIATPTPEAVATSTESASTPLDTAPANSTSTVADPTATPTPEPDGSTGEDAATGSDQGAAELVSFSAQMPDLIVSISAPATALPGENISSQVVTTIENMGSAVAEGYQVDTVLSTDRFVPEEFPQFSGRAFEEDALLSGGRTVSKHEIQPGESVSVASIILRIPRDTPVGAYYLCAVTDSANTTLESDESNNVSCTELSIGAEPSLDATEASPAATTAKSEEPAPKVEEPEASTTGCGLPSAGRTPVDLGWVLVGLIGPGFLLRRRRALPWISWSLRSLGVTLRHHDP